jgi:hypothetical protein
MREDDRKEVGDRTPLNRTQATWVADWLKDNGASVRSGWLAVYQMTPFQIAKKYRVEVAEVVSAANGEKR